MAGQGRDFGSGCGQGRVYARSHKTPAAVIKRDHRLFAAHCHQWPLHQARMCRHEQAATLRLQRHARAIQHHDKAGQDVQFGLAVAVAAHIIAGVGGQGAQSRRCGNGRACRRRPQCPQRIERDQPRPIIDSTHRAAGKGAKARRCINMEGRGKTHHPAGVVQQRPAFIGAVHQAQAISLRWVCRILHHRIFQPQPRLCIGEQRAALALANCDQEIQIASHVSQRRRHRAGRQIGIHPRRRCQRHTGQHRPIGPQGAVTGRIAAAIAPLDGAARVGHAQRLAHTFFDDLFHRLAFDA